MRPWWSRRSAQLASLAAVLLLVSPVLQLSHHHFFILPEGFAVHRGQRVDPHKAGMSAFVGEDGALLRQSLQSWRQADEARELENDATRLELERLHSAQQELLHLGGDAALVKWTQVRQGRRDPKEACRVGPNPGGLSTPRLSCRRRSGRVEPASWPVRALCVLC